MFLDHFWRFNISTSRVERVEYIRVVIDLFPLATFASWWHQTTSLLMRKTNSETEFMVREYKERHDDDSLGNFDPF